MRKKHKPQQRDLMIAFNMIFGELLSDSELPAKAADAARQETKGNGKNGTKKPPK